MECITIDIALRVLFIVVVVSMLLKLEDMEKRLPKTTQKPNKYKQTQDEGE